MIGEKQESTTPEFRKFNIGSDLVRYRNGREYYGGLDDTVELKGLAFCFQQLAARYATAEAIEQFRWGITHRPEITRARDYSKKCV
jgi:hypothetical protein